MIGLDTFADRPSEASDYIAPLLRFAAEYIPQHKHLETPVYIMATAGLRMLEARSDQENNRTIYRNKHLVVLFFSCDNCR